MDEVQAFLEAVSSKGLATGRIRGLLHILIGRRISKSDGTVISTGLTWRQLAALLKQAKFNKDHVHELGADPDALAPRDREKMWYVAIGLAKVDSLEAMAQADQLVPLIETLGYTVGPSPSNLSASAQSASKKKKQ